MLLSRLLVKAMIAVVVVVVVLLVCLWTVLLLVLLLCLWMSSFLVLLMPLSLVCCESLEHPLAQLSPPVCGTPLLLSLVGQGTDLQRLPWCTFTGTPSNFVRLRLASQVRLSFAVFPSFSLSSFISSSPCSSFM